jgi:predicted dehydrogenase
MVADQWEMTCRVIGSRATATAMNFVQPTWTAAFAVDIGSDRRVEHLGTRSSYIYQLEAFTAAVRGGVPMSTAADDAVATMRLIDSCYRAARLDPRSASE